MLMKRAGGIFASTVTYGIPFVAIAWGLIHHEHLTFIHLIGLIIVITSSGITTTCFGKSLNSIDLLLTK